MVLLLYMPRDSSIPGECSKSVSGHRHFAKGTLAEQSGNLMISWEIMRGREEERERERDRERGSKNLTM